MITVFRGKVGVHFWEASVGFCGGSYSVSTIPRSWVGMGRLIEPQKCPLHAWLSFWGLSPQAGEFPGRLGGVCTLPPWISVSLLPPSRAPELCGVGGEDSSGWTPSSGPRAQEL